MAEEHKDTKADHKKEFRKLDREARYHAEQMKKLEKSKSSILSADGYKERSHWFIWLFMFVAIAVAVLWYLFVRK